ncbi:MAG: hypothetical protein NT034_00875 [Candidatus Magasanikbacteria bacterium]|nr:hypothetical protein [Candidatus Magasanikbacteria bacterium]
MQIQNILKGSYWFYQPFIAVGAVRWFWIVIFLVMILAGLIAKIVRVANNKMSGGTQEVLRRAGNLLITMGCLGWLWMFFRQQQVSFLAWRFWLLLWVALLVWWTLKVVYYATKRLPLISTEQAKRDLQSKYLPKK